MGVEVEEKEVCGLKAGERLGGREKEGMRRVGRREGRSGNWGC